MLVQLDGHAPRRCRHLVEAVLPDPQIEFPAVISAPCRVRSGDAKRIIESGRNGEPRLDFCGYGAIRVSGMRPAIFSLQSAAGSQKRYARSEGG